MQVSVETTQGAERRMTVSVPAERIENEVSNRLRNLSRTVRLKGFRPGKVPLKVVASRYGSQVRREVISEITQSSFFEAVSQQNLQLAGLPRIEPRSTEPGRDLEYEAVFEVMEDITLAPLDQVEIIKPVVEITEQDVDAMLETLRRQRTDWRPVDRPAVAGDRVMIDFHGTIEGEEFAGNRGEQLALVLGSDSFIAGFEQGLIGARPGEERVLELRFPDDYRNAAVAGRPVRFEVRVTQVFESHLPDLDEDFIKSFDVEDGTPESLRKEVRKTMQDEAAEAIRDRVKQQVMDVLYRENPIEPPRSQLEAQTEALMAQAREALRAQGVPESEISLDRGMFEERARRRVVLGTLVREIINKHHFTAEPERVRERVESIAAGYEDPDEAIQWYYADRSRLAGVEQLVLEDHVVDWVLEQAQVVEAPMSFDELMKDRRAA